MKLMFISDIHGSEYYLEKALEIYHEGGYERLIILGDILYHGPRNQLPKGYNPAGVLEKLNALSEDIIAIRGNCDSEVDQMVLKFQIMGDYAHLLLDSDQFYLCHGHHLDYDQLPNLRENTIICSGHTHIPVYETKGKYTLFNPGSIALPKGGSNHSYGIYVDGKMAFGRIE